MSIYNISKPIFHMSRLFGLTCYTYVEEHSHKAYKHSKFWLCYCILWSCLLYCIARTLYRMEAHDGLTGFHFYSLIIVLLVFFQFVLRK